MSELTRRTYEESCKQLQDEGWIGAGSLPPLPTQRPRYDDEILGVEFFRTIVEGARFENLSLPRTYFGRSEIRNVSFAGTDLTESTLCWNDFIWVDFTKSDLSRSDLRAAIFDSVKFIEADLSQVDLRRSTFKDCDFSQAIFKGAKLTKAQGTQLHLSTNQQREVDWQETDGDEPDGG